MLKLKQQLDRTKKLKKTEILENITEARITMHDIYNRELLQDMRNDSQAEYCDSELNHLGESSKK
ncbi:14817_t:CDS:2 [Acaulospora colombiana]|uniref:14817_t:CDS:1 n=1 Tax=Acaulospora colombiana TaxID=27376 RepID=A0ACA9LBD3_9GLOM|nr:14817_t:CDS:2 [Acaulospora colombiana]